MKKRVLMSVVLLTMIGAGAVFAQQTGQGRQRGAESSTDWHPNGLATADYIVIAAFQKGSLGTQIISEFGDSFPDGQSKPEGSNYAGDRGLHLWKLEQLNAARVTRRVTPTAGMVMARPDMQTTGHCMIRTGYNQTITFITYNDVHWWSSSAKNQMFTIQPNSTVTIKKYPRGKADLVLVTGEVIIDFDYRNAASLNELMDFYASVEDVYGGMIRSGVENLKSKHTKNGVLNKDACANEIVNLYAAGNGAVGVVWSIGGLLIMPAEYLHTMAQWCVQAGMAYALAYLYGNTSNFKDDLYILFAGETVAKETIKSQVVGLAIEGSKPLTKAALLGAKVAAAKYTPQLSAKITAAAVKAAESKIGSKFLANAPVIGKVIDGAIGGGLNAAGAKTFGNFALRYYKG